MNFRFMLGCLMLAGLSGETVRASEVHLEPYIEAGGKKQSVYRLKNTDLSKGILWGGTCETPDGAGLLFGGQDQDAPDANPHTQIKQAGSAGAPQAGGWVSIYKELREKNPLQKFQERVWALRNVQKNAAAKARFIYLEGRSPEETAKRMQAEWLPVQDQAAKDLAGLLDELKGKAKDLTGGGDHEDYLTNDTWVFDPANRKSMQRHPTLRHAPGHIRLAR